MILYILILILILTLTLILVLNFNQEKFTNDTFMNNRIIVSLTTSPFRIKYINKVLKSLEDQTIKASVIYLNIPYFFKRTGETYDETILTELSKEFPLIKINRCEDKGPITKLYPVLDLETDPETKIIIVDDDHIYNNNLIENLVTEYNNNINEVIANDVNIWINIKDVDVAAAYRGILFVRKMFDKDFNDFLENALLYRHCYLSDDFVFSIYMKYKNIKLHQTANNSHGVTLNENGTEVIHVNPLGNMDNMDHNKRYNKCKIYLENMNILGMIKN